MCHAANPIAAVHLPVIVVENKLNRSSDDDEAYDENDDDENEDKQRKSRITGDHCKLFPVDFTCFPRKVFAGTSTVTWLV
jgi:hypothetical protein